MACYTGIGSRQTPLPVLIQMTALANIFREHGLTLRSGGAEGADSAFEAGAGDFKEIYLPWKNFNDNPSPLYTPLEAAFEMAARFHPAWHACSRGARCLHARNVHQVLGYDLKTPSKFLVCWTKAGKLGGGTAQAMRVAWAYGVPVINLYREGD